MSSSAKKDRKSVHARNLVEIDQSHRTYTLYFGSPKSIFRVSYDAHFVNARGDDTRGRPSRQSSRKRKCVPSLFRSDGLVVIRGPKVSAVSARMTLRNVIDVLEREISNPSSLVRRALLDRAADPSEADQES